MKLNGNNTAILTENGFTRIIFHETEIVRFNEKKIVLNNGGFKTPTTRKRMNEVSKSFDLNFFVYVANKEETVLFKDQPHQFDTGILLTR